MLDRYVAQVRLLLSTLQDIANETVFALKGGTAINLFYRDMPRLSVDIDLTYLPVADRQSSLTDIDDALDRVAAARRKRLTGYSVRPKPTAASTRTSAAPLRTCPSLNRPASQDPVAAMGRHATYSASDHSMQGRLHRDQAIGPQKGSLRESGRPLRTLPPA